MQPKTPYTGPARLTRCDPRTSGDGVPDEGEVADPPGTFGSAMRQARRSAGVSLRALGLLVHYSKGHLSKIENAIVPASLNLAEACDEALGADGQLIAAFRADMSRLAPAADSAPAGTPFDIPPPPSHFIGRDAEAAHVIEAIVGLHDDSRAPMVLIYGMPGTGKTALALHIAHTLRARFPGGCLYVDFSSGHGQRPELAIHGRLLRRLGVPASEIPAEPGEARALYLSVLYRRAVLIVADGVTSSGQVATLVPASPKCAVIATSRWRLDALDDCQPMLLSPLAADHAAALFRAVSGRADLDPDADVLRLVAACGGLPLALRVAAVKARGSHRGAAELADLLATAHTALSELDDGERSVQRVLQAQVEALPESSQRTLAMLALHPAESAGRYPAAWLAGSSPRAVEADFAELLGHDLITVDPKGRARPHGLIRTLSAGIIARLDERSREEALHRLVTGYVLTATAADSRLVPPRFQLPGRHDKVAVAAMPFDHPAQAMAWCHTEAEIIPRLCSLAFKQGLDEECWRLAYAMRDYFFAVKAVKPWIASHRIALQAAERQGNQWAQATTRNNLGMAFAEQGQALAAEAQYRQALEFYRAMDDRRGVATTWGHQAWARHAAGHHDAAVSLAEQARELNQRHDDRRSLAIMDRTAALAYAKSGRPAQALMLLAECEEILSELDLPLDVAMMFNCMGEVHSTMGQFGKARAFHSLAAEHSAACGGLGEQSRAARGLAFATR
jgi:tetratricopeptide (TPR) repeat protein/transcriptional regulator with XRE-family HTH domain